MQSSSDKAYEIITNKLKDTHKKRYEHILGVCEMAEYLAKIKGVERAVRACDFGAGHKRRRCR